MDNCKWLLSSALLCTALVVHAQEKIVLYEQFTNASCPTCGTWSPQVYSFIEARDTQAVLIAYHTDFPHYDGIFLDNPTDVNARVAYYNVQGTPQTMVDGNVFNGASAVFVQSNPDTVHSNRQTEMPKVLIECENFILNAQAIDGFVKVTPATDLTGEDLVVHIVVVEREVFRDTYTPVAGNNSETSYPYVMREMIPTAAGTPLTELDSGMVTTIPVNVTITNAKSYALEVIAFVQNNTTKEVYQASKVIPEVFMGISDAETEQFDLYPNPVDGVLTIEPADDKEYTLQLLSIEGKLLQEHRVIGKTNTQVSSLSSGFYLACLRNAEGQIVGVKKLVK